MRSLFILAICVILGGVRPCGIAEVCCCAEPCDQIDGVIHPEQAYQTLCGSTVGASNGDLAYSFCTVAGGFYRFTFCEADGWADFNTGLSVQTSDCSQSMVTNDDYCGLQSQVDFSAPADSIYVIVIAGDMGSAGEFCLAYRGAPGGSSTEDSAWGRIKAIFR